MKKTVFMLACCCIASCHAMSNPQSNEEAACRIIQKLEDPTINGTNLEKQIKSELGKITDINVKVREQRNLTVLMEIMLRAAHLIAVIDTAEKMQESATVTTYQNIYKQLKNKFHKKIDVNIKSDGAAVFTKVVLFFIDFGKNLDQKVTIIKHFLENFVQDFDDTIDLFSTDRYGKTALDYCAGDIGANGLAQNKAIMRKILHGLIANRTAKRINGQKKGLQKLLTNKPTPQQALQLLISKLRYTKTTDKQR